MALVATPAPSPLDEEQALVPLHPQLAEGDVPCTLKFAAHVLDEKPQQGDSDIDEDEAAKDSVPELVAGAAAPNLLHRGTVRIKTRASVALENLPVGKLHKIWAKDKSSFAHGADSAKSFAAFTTVFSGTNPGMTPEYGHVWRVSESLGNIDCAGLSTMTDSDINVDSTYQLPPGWTGLLMIDDDTKRLLDTGVKHTFQGSVMDMADVLGSFPHFVEQWVTHTKMKYVDKNSGRKRPNGRAKLNKKQAQKIFKQGEEASDPLEYAMANLILTHKVFVCTRLILHPEDGSLHIPEDFVEEIRERMIKSDGVRIPDDTQAAVRQLNAEIDGIVGDLHVGKKIPVYVGAEVRATIGKTTEEHNEDVFKKILGASGGSYTVAREVCGVLGDLETMGEVRRVFDRSITFPTMEEAVAFVATKPKATRKMYEIVDMTRATEEAEGSDPDGDDEPVGDENGSNEAGPSS